VAGGGPLLESAEGRPITATEDWVPGTSAAVAWSVIGVAVTVPALVLFSLPIWLRSGVASGSIRFGVVELLAVVGLTVLLMAVHELIHATLMRGFGARPRFGTMLVGGVAPALYATAPGYQFTHGQYLAIAAAPTVAISVLGFLACFGPWAGYLIVPLAIHLGGCVGDGFAVLRTLREPSTSRCEDLRDGVRFHRAGATTVSGGNW
jgi:hypothetical protein